MSRATVDLQSVRFFLGYGLVFIAQSALTILLAAVAMFALQPGAGGAGAGRRCRSWSLVAVRYGRRSRPALQEVQQRIAELTADAEENVSGVRVVKAFAAEARQLERFRGAGRGACSTSRCIATRLRAFYNPFIGFLPNLGLAVILLVGGRQVINGTLTLGDFTAFYAYLLMLIGPMRTLGIALGLAQRATASGARLFEILDREPRIVVAGGRAAAAGRARARRAARRHVRLRATARRSLRDVDLDVEAGTTVALVGATGSGKTTLVSLLAAALRRRPAASVLIDGADVRDVDLDSLRRADRASSTDDPFLFSATVHDNIAYARPDATREEVERAAERAQAAGFIAELPDGYDTRVGERGLTLSGGQRQRIAIARALLADPRILVLDDATSSVDASTEQAIKAALREVMAGRTTFVIAHRLSTIALADDIVVLEDGADRRARHARRAAARAASCTRRSRRRACRTRSSSTATRSRGWRACERAAPSARAAGRPPPPLARDARARAQAARADRAAAALPRARGR